MANQNLQSFKNIQSALRCERVPAPSLQYSSSSQHAAGFTTLVAEAVWQFDTRLDQ